MQIAAETGTTIQATQEEIVSTDAATISDHFISALMTIGENNGGNALGAVFDLQPYNEHTELGQNIGNVITLTQGAFEIGSGLAGAGGGAILTILTSPLCATVIGCAVPASTATVTAGSLVLISHGSAVIGNTIYNMSSNQGSSSRSGGRTVENGGRPTNKDRKAVYDENRARNGGNLVCEECGIGMVPAKKSQKGVKPPRNEASIDHIKPVSKGGTSEKSNLRGVCRGCNRDKGNKFP